MEFLNYDMRDTFLIVTFVIIFGLLTILSLYFNIIAPLARDREYIKMEMRRSEGKEYYYWKKELRKLYIKYIPLIGKFFR